ncbi:MAG: hypothetical protein ACRD4D_00815 [Candidatus Acidiferrales bacterium]
MISPPKEERAVLEAIRHGTAPAIIKRQASRGSLPVAAGELLEILVVLLADPDPTMSGAARVTLDAWTPEKIAEALADAETSADALAYFAAQKDTPDSLAEIIVNHPHADDRSLVALAPRLSPEKIQSLAAQPDRLAELPGFVAVLLERSDLPGELREAVEKLHLEQQKEKAALEAALQAEEETEVHATEEEKRQRVSLTKKVSIMSVSERVQLGLKGNKDERMILIRDPSKVVYRAVLQSPKISDSEIEGFASMKNIADEALRIMGTNRKFLKIYGVVRNLVNNPRTPLDISLGLMARLTENDLKNLSRNRNVPETVRSLALKAYKQKTETRKSG